MRMRGWRGIVAATALAVSLGSAQPARAGFLEDAGWGSLTVLSNVVYMPVKLVYATLGGLTGGIALGLTGGDLDVAETIWVTSMGGNYVLTPPMLRGEESISVAGTPGITSEPLDSGEPAPTGDDLSRRPAFNETDLGS
jgi:hypothetical protein